MQCPNCQHENKAGRKFCGQCGAKLGWKCAVCGYLNDPEDRFCGDCGQKQSEPGPPQSIAPPKLEDMHAQLQRLIPQSLAERMHLAEQELVGENRLVTALFADISGFTRLSQQLSSEAAFEKVQGCFKLLVDIISAYEGSISGFRGDGLLALFGAPLTHENDPERAILSAIDMRAKIQEMGLQMTIGVNTGVMTVGKLTTQLHSEYAAYSPDVNLASRLQGAAQPGQILVGESTYRSTRRAFAFEPTPPLTLKNIAKPVTAYQVLKVLLKPEKIRGIEGLKAPMIGRDEEFAKLKGCLDDLMNGRGQIASIIGVAGVGKSRLVTELKASLQRREEWKDGRMEEEVGDTSQPSNLPPFHPLWLEGRCLSIGESVGYWVFIDILKSYFQFDLQDNERTMAEKIVAAVKGLLPQQADEILPLFGNLLLIKFGNELDDRLKFAGPEQIKHQTFMALRDFFIAVAGRQPLVLTFEGDCWLGG